MSYGKTFAAALILSGCIAGAALAQNAPEQATPDKGTTIQAKCIEENDGYKMVGKHPMFVIELENKCAQRMLCKVFANVSSAKGNALGSGTLILAGKAKGPAAKKSFTMRVKMLGGSSQSTRECRAI